MLVQEIVNFALCKGILLPKGSPVIPFVDLEDTLHALSLKECHQLTCEQIAVANSDLHFFNEVLSGSTD